MIALPLALSLTSSLTTVGALAAFVGLLGIALVSLLVFSQSREIKRLREWAGRAPERAAELEQRVGAQGVARAGRMGAPAGAVRVTPRATPLVSAPVSSAVQASAAAATGSHPLTRTSAPAGAAPPVPAAAGGTTAVAEGTVGQPTVVATPDALGVTPPAEEQGPAAQPAGESDEAQPVGESDTAQPIEELDTVEPADDATDVPESTPAPATAAARATRSPLPPAPPPAARAAALRSSGTRPVRRPPGERGRMEAERARRAADPVSRRPSRSGGASTSYYRQQGSPARGVALIVGSAIIGVLLIALVVSVLKGSSGASPSGKASPLVQTKGSLQGAAGEGAQAASTPAEVAVVVLNGTSTAGLAHHIAAALQQSGYSRAEASAGVPPGSPATTVVEYTSGHRADAQAVAKALNVTKVQPIDSSTAQLASMATVVVLAGADQATVFSGGSQSRSGSAGGAATGAASETGASGAAESAEGAAGAAH